MQLNDYQKQAITTDSFDFTTGDLPALDSHAFVSKILGLTGEAGEVAEKFKKLFRDNGGQLDDTAKQQIAKELGDVLWYTCALATYMGIDLESIAQNNLDKLAARKANGTIQGSGDER
jgi:NTP pyrophosphatase (non-canonical NTP hydrolase)